MTSERADLSALGNVVDPEYVHVTKQITAGPPLVLPDAFLKWYQLARPDQTITPAADQLTRDFLREEVAAGRLPISGDLGFVIHHLSGEHIHLLLVFTWRGNNEMWETVYVRDARTDAPYALGPQDTHRGTMCVWEFGAIAHEHQAWTQYLRSPRDEAAKHTYTDSQYAGPI
jgi:hypothetical protein